MSDDQLMDLTRAVVAVANSITAPALPGIDAAGGEVTSLTESVMGITAGLFRVADAIDGLADAVRNRPADPAGKFFTVGS